MKINFPFKILFTTFFLIQLTSCSYLKKDESKKDKKEQETILKKKKKDHNLKKRAEEYDGGIIFGKNGVFSGGGSKAQFAANNVLWRASVSTLDFTPLVTANYSGGIIITDWYSKKNSSDSIKIQIVFNSNELSPSSFEVKSFKKKCKEDKSCSTIKMNNNFNSKIKQQILENAKKIKIKLESEN